MAAVVADDKVEQEDLEVDEEEEAEEEQEEEEVKGGKEGVGVRTSPAKVISVGILSSLLMILITGTLAVPIACMDCNQEVCFPSSIFNVSNAEIP
jgi:hypothetical protein